MKKRREYIFVFLALILASMPFALAAIDFKKEAISTTVIKEVSTPAIYNFTIKNNLGSDDFYMIDSQLDMKMQPSGSFKVDASSEKNFLVKVYLSKNMREEYTGSRFYEYFIKSQYMGLQSDTFEIKIVSLRDVLDINIPEGISMTDKSMEITIKNKEATLLEGAIKIDSELFKKSDSLLLMPFEQKTIVVSLNKEEIWKEAGKYPIIISLIFDNYPLNIEKVIELKANKEISTEEKKTNLVIYQRRYVKKTNVGNVPNMAEVTMTLPAFIKAFTSFNIQPTSIQQVNGEYVLEWKKELRLGEELVVTANTNFYIPLAILAALAVLVLIYYLYKKTPIVIEKKAIRALTNTGDFATKVIVTVKNRGKEVTDATLIDSLPPLATLHERFGAERPDRIDRNALIWNLNTMQRGEQKIFSYVIYTKIKVIGALTIPQARVTYRLGNKEKIAVSNLLHVAA